MHHVFQQHRKEALAELQHKNQPSNTNIKKRKRKKKTLLTPLRITHPLLLYLPKNLTGNCSNLPCPSYQKEITDYFKPHLNLPRSIPVTALQQHQYPTKR